MHIAYVINFAGKAGTEKYVENLMRCAVEKGDTCSLVYCIPGELSEKAPAYGKVFRLDMSPRHILRAARELASLCEREHIDILHAQYPRENVIAVLSRRYCPRTRVIFTSHLTVKQNAIWHYVNRIMTTEEDAVISVCEAGVPLLKANGVCPEKITVIPNGVKHRDMLPRTHRLREEFSLPENAFIFLTMARYAPEKGLPELVDAVRIANDGSTRPVCCVICGDGEEYEEITRQIRALGLADRVIQAGYRTDTEALLSFADAYVSSARYNEAMSFAILEAMSQGLPLVLTDVGAARELARGCGLISPPGDGDALGRNMARLAENAALAETLGREARRRVTEEYDLGKQTDVLWQTYENALKKV